MTLLSLWVQLSNVVLFVFGVSLGSAAALSPPLLLVVLNVSGVLSLHFPFETIVASQEVASTVVRSRAPCLLCW